MQVILVVRTLQYADLALYFATKKVYKDSFQLVRSFDAYLVD